MTSSRKDPYRALHGGARRIGSPNLAGIWKAPFDPAQAVAAGRGRGGVDSGRPTFGRRPERRADGTLRLLRRLGRSVSFVAIIHPPPTDTVRFRGIASNRGAGEECLGGRAVREASAPGEAERQVAADTSGNHALDPNRCPPRYGPLAVSNARKLAHRVNSSGGRSASDLGARITGRALCAAEAPERGKAGRGEPRPAPMTEKSGAPFQARRRLTAAKPRRPKPIRAAVAGSGTGSTRATAISQG